MNAQAGVAAHRAAWLGLQGLTESDLSALRAGALPPGAQRWMRRAALHARLYAGLAVSGAIALSVVAVLDGSVVIAVVAGHEVGIEIVGAGVAAIAAVVLLARSHAALRGSALATLDGVAFAGARSSGDAEERTLTIDGIVYGASTHPIVSVLHGAISPGTRVRAYLAGDARTLVAVEPGPSS